MRARLGDVLMLIGWCLDDLDRCPDVVVEYSRVVSVVERLEVIGELLRELVYEAS